MATVTIKTRQFGDIDFCVNDAGGYVHMYCRNLGWDGRQPCRGGSFRGPTLYSAAGRLGIDARTWWKAYRRRERATAAQPATHGGARPNSGRKARDGAQGLQRYSVTLDAASVEALRRTGAGDLSLAIRHLAKALAKD